MQTALNPKINDNHLSRKAVVYVRQSSERQVRQNTESSRLQYALTQRARDLGFNNTVVIDEDLGKSAGYDSQRTGFNNLVSMVGMKEVGIVISLEATRLARNNRDWYHLMDLCSLFDTLIGDQQVVYDPKDANDRLVLGMKGSMSEAELNLIKFRMKQGRLSKAQRGELINLLPSGYVFDGNRKVVKSNDTREREAIALVFRKFEELGSAKQTHNWLLDEKIKLLVYNPRTMEVGKKRWQLPTYDMIREMLHNPFYTGAYVYGRRETRVFYEDGQIKKTTGHFRKSEDWDVLIKDHHEGYISFEQYEKNVLQMKNNRPTNKADESVGAVRAGKAILVGLIRCGRCGRKMRVRYWGKNGTNPRYLCSGDYHQGGTNCQSFASTRTDEVFEEELFKAIEPAAVQASIDACLALDEMHVEKLRYLDRELENARYEANRAFTQYNAADPLNRLVVTELEKQWNEKLMALEEVEKRIEREKAATPDPTPEEISMVRSLCERLPEVWKHPQTDPMIKKRIIRLMVEEVIVRLDESEPMLDMMIHWKGGIHTQVRFKKPTRGNPPVNKTNDEVIELIQKLAPHHTDEEIALVLSRFGMKTGLGNDWTRVRVRGFRANNKIAPFDRKKAQNVLSLNQTAKQLELKPHSVRQLIEKGIIKAEQLVKYAPFIIEASELEKEEVQTAVRNLKKGHSLRNFGVVNKNQISF